MPQIKEPDMFLNGANSFKNNINLIVGHLNERIIQKFCTVVLYVFLHIKLNLD